jgi:hypothetical protein
MARGSESKSQPFELALLEHAQKFQLHLRRDFADLVGVETDASMEMARLWDSTSFTAEAMV